MDRKLGPGESFLKNPRPGEQRDGEQDVEGHGLGATPTRPDGALGRPTPGHDGIVTLPRTGGELVDLSEDKDR